MTLEFPLHLRLVHEIAALIAYSALSHPQNTQVQLSRWAKAGDLNCVKAVARMRGHRGSSDHCCSHM